MGEFWNPPECIRRGREGELGAVRDLLENAGGILIGGHRGCQCGYPENSISAMEEGLKRGADYLEIDIQLTRDKTPVVIHDVRLEKQTEMKVYVHEHSLEELKEVIPGLCTLREALAWGREKGAYFALEMKTVPLEMQAWNMELAELTGALLYKTGMRERVFVFGPDYQVLKHLKALYRDVEIGLIAPFVPADPVDLMKEMEALVYLSYIYNMTPSMIRNLQQAGFYVSGAILKEEHWVRRAMELGVNMFESDEPWNWKGLSLTNGKN